MQRNGERDLGRYGLSVNDVYKDLYKKEFQFQRRHKNNNIIHVKAKEALFTMFIAGIFGKFPPQKAFEYFESNYKDVFDPSLIELDAIALSNVYKTIYLSPLMVGCEAIKVHYHEHRLHIVYFGCTRTERSH